MAAEEEDRREEGLLSLDLRWGGRRLVAIEGSGLGERDALVACWGITIVAATLDSRTIGGGGGMGACL